MANKNSKALSPELEKRLVGIFRKIDTNDSKTIDREETLKYWKSNFAKINTEELFSAVDKDGNGAIELHEWIEFWTAVKKAGHSEEEIGEELEALEKGEAWCKFSDVKPSYKKQVSKNS